MTTELKITTPWRTDMPSVSNETIMMRERATRTATPVAYGYTRVSHDASFKKGDSLPAQEKRIEDYFQTNLSTFCDWGGVRNDGQSVSAFRVPFSIRPAGKEIMALLEPGDHIIMDKPDRVWRSIKDFVNLMEDMKNRDITVHIVNFLGQSIKNNTPMGEFILGLFVMTAQLESTIKSERIKEGVAEALKKGKGVKKYHAGCYYDEKGELHWDRRERAVMSEIVRLLSDERMEWNQAFPKIEEFEAKLYGRPIRTITQQFDDRSKRWRRMYRNERAYRYLNLTDPSMMPSEKILSEARRQWNRVKAEERMCASTKFWNQTILKNGCTYSKVEVITPEQLLKLT